MDRDFTLGSHNARLDTIETRLSVMDGKLDTLIIASERRSGAKTLAGAIGGFVGFIASLAVAWFSGKNSGP